VILVYREPGDRKGRWHGERAGHLL
jgi:hypothetical protein